MPLEINFTDLPDDDDDRQEPEEYLTEAEQIYRESQLCTLRNPIRRRPTDSGRSRDEPPLALPFPAGLFDAPRRSQNFKIAPVAALASSPGRRRRFHPAERLRRGPRASCARRVKDAPHGRDRPSALTVANPSCDCGRSARPATILTEPSVSRPFLAGLYTSPKPGCTYNRPESFLHRCTLNMDNRVTARKA